MSLWSRIRGTSETLFQIAFGVQLKNNAVALEVRNATDAAFAIARGATPVAGNDLATKAYVDAGDVIAEGGVQQIRFAITNAAAQNSATSIPAGSIVIDAEIDVVTPYSGGATITIGSAASPALLQATTDNTPGVAGLYGAHQDTAWGGVTGTVLVTVGGAPAAGAGFCIVRYVQTSQA